MKLYQMLFGLLLLLVIHTIPAQASTVIRVVSGDTIIIDGGQAVKLLGVVAPTGEEFYSEESQQGLVNLVLGQEVDVETDSVNAIYGHKDPSGRTLAYVYRSKDRLFVNFTMLQKGYGFFSPKYVRKNDTKFMLEAIDAKRQKRGLWAKAELSPEERAKLENRPYEEPAFEFKPEYKDPDLRVEILWAKKADPRSKKGFSADEVGFLGKIFQDEAVNKGEVPALRLLRKNLATELTKFYAENKVALKIETEGEEATVLKFIAEGMDQETADKFCTNPFNKQLFSGLEFSEVVFTDDDKFSYSYKVTQ